MRDEIKASIQRVKKLGFDFAAGDQLYYVAPDGTKTSLLTIQWTNVRGDAEGLEVYTGGVEDQEERVIVLLRTYLEANGIEEIDPTGYFEILGQRWDLVVDSPIVTKSAPHAATNPTVRLLVRKAVELEHSQDVTEMEFDLT